MKRNSMLRAVILWLALSLIGILLIVFIPENLFGSTVLFRLSDEHGPTLSNSLGIFMILGAWIYYLVQLWRRRDYLKKQRVTPVLIVAIILSTAGCLFAASYNLNILIAIFGLCALVAQISLGLLGRKPI